MGWRMALARLDLIFLMYIHIPSLRQFTCSEICSMICSLFATAVFYILQINREVSIEYQSTHTLYCSITI